MVAGLGTDMVEIGRVEGALRRHGQAFMHKVFTEREQALFDRAADGEADDGSRLLQEVAARFAAKEAALKALGTGWGRGLGWHDVEILGGRGEPPTLALSAAAEALLGDRGGSRAHVSMTHTDHTASATVLLD